jgi:cell division transport system permease protein
MLKKRKINFFYSIVSVAMVLFLFGFFGTALLFTRQEMIQNKEQIEITVEIKDSPDSLALAQLKPSLENSIFVKKGSVRFVSKKEAGEFMKKQFEGDELLVDDGPLPYSDAYTLNLNATYLRADSIEHIRQTLKENKAVADVVLDDGMVGEVSKNIEKIALFAFGIALLFTIVAITLIHNTIRLNIYTDRFLIKNMELIGASWSFITRPYIRKSVWNGLLSSLLSISLLGIIFYFVQKELPRINLLLKSPVFLGFLSSILIFGILISWLSTLFVVNKYLKMRLDDLY